LDLNEKPTPHTRFLDLGIFATNPFMENNKNSLFYYYVHEQQQLKLK
ncbi:14942_t:CDS:1, partial [Entrophospora sp. SA101]